jgi:hypothetical protein
LTFVKYSIKIDKRAKFLWHYANDLDERAEI